MYDFFGNAFDGELIGTLAWFVFEEYSGSPIAWTLASCPVCGHAKICLDRPQMSAQHTFLCPSCGQPIYLTDVFRLHEVVDDELGAEGILGYVTTAIEQMILVHIIRLILRTKPSLLRQVLMIKDGPLAFFGQTANMHKPMRDLVRFLYDFHDLYLTGLEKSGPFVEHADEVASLIDNGTILILDNDYIYRYVLPGKADPENPYGGTTYYSNKLIFKTRSGQMYVMTLPCPDVIPSPTEGDFRNLQVILTNIERLKCDMYDNALVPVALVNKLVSLASHPSSKILQKFAIQAIYP